MLGMLLGQRLVLQLLFLLGGLLLAASLGLRLLLDQLGLVRRRERLFLLGLIDWAYSFLPFQ